MENFNIDLIISSIESKNVNLNWATANLGLVEKMRKSIKQEVLLIKIILYSNFINQFYKITKMFTC